MTVMNHIVIKSKSEEQSNEVPLIMQIACGQANGLVPS